MFIDSAAADRYAQALLSAVKDSGEISLEEVLKALSRANQILISDPGLKSELQNPMVSLEEKKFLVKKKLGLATSSKVLFNLFDLLLTKKRMNLLALILFRFEALMAESQGIMKAHVKSAAALDETAKRDIEAKLSKLFNKKVSVEASVDPQLLAGLVIKAGDTVIDNSLKSKLRSMREVLTQ